MSDFSNHQAHVITHSIVITLLPLSPIPFADWILEPIVARRLFTPLMKHPNQRRHFIGKGGNFCLGCITSLLLYPFVKLIRILRFFLQFNTFVKTFFYWYYKGYIVHQAQSRLSESTLQDHQKMFLLGQEVDQWLRTSDQVPSMTSSSLTNLQSLRRLYSEVKNGDRHTVQSILENTDSLDAWLESWCDKHDTPN